MTTSAENEILTKVSRGTPMGDFMREYWIPAAASGELTKDGPPMRLLLLGEKLVAFRDSSGKVGIMDHRCPHRLASLALGRNEEHGLRCIYHGWKFDVSGRCVDLPNVPASERLAASVPSRGYQTQEKGGVIWVYMGTKSAPPLPALEPLEYEDEELFVQFIQRKCNWLQSLEGDIDTSHFDFLHAGALRPEDFDKDDPRRFGNIHRAPKIVVEKTGWGTMYGAQRPAEAGGHYWRVAHFMFPFWTQTPNRPLEGNVSVRGWVPMDDTHVMSLRITRKKGGGKINPFTEYLPRTTGWYGRWETVAREENDFTLDREDQKHGSFSGISGTFTQDQAVCESMGAISERELEYLVPSDRMIISTRRALIQAAQAFRNDATPPPGSRDPEVYRNVRAGYFVAPEDEEWVSAYRNRLDASLRAAK